MLTERQKKILWAIVDDYILSAEPVGSRTVSKKGIGVSPATVRNEMADLEEMGFLEQPHTSAGRIPSQKGYRFYVDHLLMPYVLNGNDQVFFELDQTKQMELEMQRVSAQLSQLTNYMTMIVSPRVLEGRLKHLSIVPITEQVAVSVLVSDTGQVEQHRIFMPELITISMLEQLENLLNDQVIGLPFSKLKQTALQKIKEELKHFPQHLLPVILDQLFAFEPSEQVFLSGTTRMLTQPEFRDVEKMRSLLDLVEAHELILQLLEPNESIMQGIQVRIGSELSLERVEHCSMITASFMIDDDPIGTIGVLGPTRMDYGKVIKLIDQFAKSVSSSDRQRLK